MSLPTAVDSLTPTNASEVAALASFHWPDLLLRMAAPATGLLSSVGAHSEEERRETNVGCEGVGTEPFPCLPSRAPEEQERDTGKSRELPLSAVPPEKREGRRGKFGFPGPSSGRNVDGRAGGDAHSSLLGGRLHSVPAHRPASLLVGQRSGTLGDSSPLEFQSDTGEVAALSSPADTEAPRSLVKDNVVQFILQEICDVAKDCKSDLDDLVSASADQARGKPTRPTNGNRGRASTRRDTTSSVVSINPAAGLSVPSEHRSTEGVEKQIKQLHAFLTHELLPSVDRAKAEADALRRSNAVLGERLRRSEEHRQLQTEQIDDLQDEWNRSQFENRHHLAEAVERLKAENFHLKSQLDLTEKHLDDERKEKTTLEQKVLALEKRAKEKKEPSEPAETTALRDQLAAVRREMKRLTTLSSQKDSMIEDLKEVVRVARGETAAMSARALRSSHGSMAVDFPRGETPTAAPSPLASEMTHQMKMRMMGSSAFQAGGPVSERLERRKEMQRVRRSSGDSSTSRVDHQESLAAELLGQEGKAGKGDGGSAFGVTNGASSVHPGSAPQGSRNGAREKDGGDPEKQTAFGGSGETPRVGSARGDGHALCERRIEALQHELEELKKNHAQLLDRNEILKKYNVTLEKHFEAELLQYVKKDEVERVQRAYEAARAQAETLSARCEKARMEQEDTQAIERRAAAMVPREEAEKKAEALRREKEEIAREKDNKVKKAVAEKAQLERRKDEEIKELSGKLAEFERCMKTAESERDKLRKLLELEKKDNVELGGRLAALQAAAEKEASTLKGVLEKEKEARGILDNARLQKEAELVARQKEVARLSEEIRALKEEQKTKQEEMEKQLEAQDAEVRRVKDRHTTVLAEMDSFQREKTLQHEALSKALSELDSVKAKQSALQEEAAALRSQLDRAREENRKMSETLEAVRASRAGDHAALEETQTDLDRTENWAKMLEIGKSEVEAQLAKSSAECSAISHTCAMLKEEVETIKKKREKDLAAFKTRLQQKNNEKKKQILQMLEVNENLAMRKEEMETRFVEQLQDARRDIDRLVGLHVRQSYMRRGSQLSLPAPPKNLSSFANQMWHMHEAKADSLPDLTERTSSLKSARKTHRAVAMYRPVALSIQNLVHHSPGAGGEKRRTTPGSGDSLGEDESDLLDFIPDLVSRIRSKFFKGQNASEGNFHEQSPRLPEESTSSASEVERTSSSRRSSTSSSPRRSDSVESSGSLGAQNLHWAPSRGFAKSRSFLRSMKSDFLSGKYPPMVAMWEPTIDETTDNGARLSYAREEGGANPVHRDRYSSPCRSSESLPAIRITPGSIFGSFPGRKQRPTGVWEEMEEIFPQKETYQRRDVSTVSVAEPRSDKGCDEAGTESGEKDGEGRNRIKETSHTTDHPLVPKRTRRPRELMNYIDVESRTFYTPRRR
ncbi:conserved hypothetical protein [Neospora caninum Liverpool]|uniref:Myosin heavy chain n=1 Tax=Neospora caninum (strain Liverpool) TaxID=572307 RepID=F0VNE3_NEOCL|nr:conserved hypothetical protein [Neospora caninum Liverpool]CBZ55239.1 conserved hypothetical protein [Neospora caninum Liverpool]CEL69968.1 TPA: hypothetical protein BN1204_056630 [Neospora caninum Liverpool]|eukprot:XP_003885267.1 conserved hypothetical protein [Neospora caninum Liverpool]